MAADPLRFLVIGGDAAGMSAASQAKKFLGDRVAVTVLERTGWTSYSACGIPYWIAGDVDGPDALVARGPDAHRGNGIDVRVHTEATAIDTAARTVTVRGPDGKETLAYDELLIATGAEPIRPDLPGIDAAGIYGVQTLDDGARIVDALDKQPHRAVIVGSGYIGLEMAEACVRRGLETVVVDQTAAPLAILDTDLGARVHVAMSAMDIDVRMDNPVRGFTVGSDGMVTGVETAAGAIPADIVLLGLGVRARSELAVAAGLPTGVADGIRVEPSMRVPGVEHVWAAGDCVVSRHRLTDAEVHIALGTHANKQGMVVGRNIAALVTGGPTMEFGGVLGTAITKVCDLEIAVTGLSAGKAAAAGFEAVTASADTTTTAGYMPEARPMTVRLTAERGSRRLLGGQIVGREGAAMRIDTIATALWAGLTVDDVIMSDLAYAPPFSSVWDPVQVAARMLAKELAH